MTGPQTDTEISEASLNLLWSNWTEWVRPRRGLRLIITALGVKRAQWRGEDRETETADAAFRKAREGVLDAQQHTCQFCGFSAQSGIEVHHLDDNHRNNDPSNFAAADGLCHGDHHIGQVGSQKDGVLASVPLTIEDLNHLQRTIQVALQSGDKKYADRAKRMVRYLVGRRGPIEAAFGTSDPSEWAEALLGLTPGQYDRRADLMQGVGLVYHPKRFASQARRWAEEEYRALPPARWEQIHARYSPTAASAG
jgi:intracellular multiplication protein IcmJ